ncbi:MAG: TauD/TfdA family dioxygenase [Gammaproteobacteria bacterium]|nr:TauD/TfdA family dioxygenase [Gammaproteobacteria bacterium]MDE0256996.1 TauD/TfdA family dioxygenase [Gammaproteobacteria bacterium]
MQHSISSVSPNAGALAAVWSSGERTELPYLWLRDNCGCSECRVVQTTEKRFHIFEVASDLRPLQVGIERAESGDEAISIAWPDGHQTRYRASEIHGLLSQPRSELRYWDGRFQPRQFDYARFLASDQAAAELIEEFLRTGVCVLVDAPAEPDSSEQLATRLGPVREVLFERIHNVKVDPKGYNIAHTGLAVAPHNDFTSYTWPPSVQALHMLVNECDGGESIVVDGFGLLHELRSDSPDKFDALCAVPVPFRIFSERYEVYAANPMVELDSAGEVRMMRFNTAQMQAVPLSEPRLSDFYDAYHELSRRVNDVSAQVTFRLEGGQVLLCAGHRVLHGRTALRSNGQRHLQDAYFEHDNARTHLRWLRLSGRI